MPLIIPFLWFAFIGLQVDIAAHAEITTEDQDIKPIFLELKTGHQVSATEAFKEAMKGTRILKCDEVQPHVSSKGSGTLKKKATN